MNDKQIEKLKQVFGGPMTQAEIDFLQDMKAFIDFAVENGLSLGVVVGTLLHDVSEISRSGFSLEDARRSGFRPRVDGYSQIDAQSIGESEDAA